MTTWLRLIRAEVRKLTTTWMPAAVLLVLGAIASTSGAIVVWGTDADGGKSFVATAADQQSLMAFAFKAMIVASLFGAIAVAREYGHNTVVTTYLAAPRRHRPLLAQYAAVALGGAVIGLIGAALTITAIAVTLPTTGHHFMVSIAGVTEVLAASAFAGAAAAALGAGIGALVRNTGGAVTIAVLVLMIAPPLIVQIADGAASWVPSTLTEVLSGVAHDVSTPAAGAALALWAVIPAVAGLIAVRRRDVV